jgi:hypothetical protein
MSTPATLLLAILCCAWVEPSDDVLELLEARCFKCHGPEVRRAKGGLRMNGRAALLAGGHGGPAIVPGDADASLLIQAVRRLDEDVAMPPDEALSDDEVQQLVTWINAGADWPGDDATAADREPAVAAHDKRDAELPHDPFADVQPDPAMVQEFERLVRPVLVESCYECHGPNLESPKGGLKLTSRKRLLAGGHSGPAVVPGNPRKSLLMQALGYHNPDLQMPPDAPLPEQQRVAIQKWIRSGALWPPGDTDDSDHELEAESRLDLDLGREWWAFRPVVRTEPATTQAAPHPIDAFVQAGLDAAGLSPNPPTARRQLVRRAYLDLIGLPPTFEQVTAFEIDTSPDAYERLIDELLQRSEYGERWGRHWLDVVRYAQTNGYETDEEKVFAWRYRDWVIDALNADMPYDEFLTAQLAGDELDEPTSSDLIATGFYRLGVWDSEPDDGRQAAYDDLDDMLRTITEGMLGVTLGCARCHDHKFDPFGQDDYYAMTAFLRGIRPYEQTKFSEDSATLALLDAGSGMTAAWDRERNEYIADLEARSAVMLKRGRQIAVQRLLQELPPEVRAAYKTPARARTPEQAALIAGHPRIKVSDNEASKALPREQTTELLDMVFSALEAKTSFEGDLDWGLVVSERGAFPAKTHLLNRGLASLPGKVLQPAFVRVMCANDDEAMPPERVHEPGAASSGRRRQLAAWVSSNDNPLTARVFVNRVWQHLFGRGLVDTLNDFGVQGSPPSHPELLDWLADEFMASGWSTKQLQRLIMTSAVYKRSSLARGNEMIVDPGNTLLWRQNLRRLEAEAIRDSVLTVSGRLNSEMGGRGFFPAVSRETMSGASKPGDGWGISSERQRDRRAVYAYIKRGMIAPLFEAFDGADTTQTVGQRLSTTIVSQSFLLLNSEFMNQQAEHLTERVLVESEPDPDAWVHRLYELTLSRVPAASELELALDYLESQARGFSQLTPALVFRPRVPSRTGRFFQEALVGNDVLYGPRQGWTYLTGPWGGMYNYTLELDRARGPTALLDGSDWDDLTLRARLLLAEGSELAAVVVRARRDGPSFHGVDVLIDPIANEIRVTHQDGKVDDLTVKPTVLARAPFLVPIERWFELELEARGARIIVRVDGRQTPIIDVEHSSLVGSGQVGLRTWGQSLSVSSLSIQADDGETRVPIPRVADDARALQSLALTLMNLNEFLYVE